MDPKGVERAKLILMRNDTSERTKDEARAVLRQAGEPEPKVEDGIWNYIPMADMFAPLPQYPWLLEGLHMAPGRCTLLAGYANSGKTIVAQNIALSVMTGEPLWRRHAPARTGKVLHLNGEIGSYIAKQRYQRLARGMSYVDFSGIVKSGNLTFANYPKVTFDDKAFEHRLGEACAGHELVIVDSLRAFSGNLDENAKTIGVAMFSLARVSEMTGATFLVLHHTRKTQGPPGQQVSMSEMIAGSSSILGAAECAFVMAGAKGEPVAVHHERSPLGQPMADFGLQFRDLARGEDKQWGLRIEALDQEELEDTREQVQSRKSVAKDQRDLTRSGSKLFDVIQNSPGGVFVGSKKDLKEAVGGNSTAFATAYSRAKAENLIVMGGTYHSPTYRINSDNEPR